MGFIDNSPLSTLPNWPKADLNPIGTADPTKNIQAVDWNALAQALTDIQTWERAGKWTGFAPQTSDPAPTGITNYLWTLALANRNLPGVTPSYGTPFQFQSSMARRTMRWWKPRPGSTTVDQLGASLSTGAGTLTARQPGPTPSNLFNSLSRIGNVSGATGTSVASNYDGTGYHCWRGNAAGLGGFHLVFRFGISDAVLNANARMFVGLMSNVGIASDPGNPSSLTQLLGVGCDAGDTAMQLYSAGTAAQSRVSLGANFPVNTVSTDVYELHLHCAANDTSVYYTLNRYTTSQLAPAQTISGSVTGTTAQLIAAGTMFMPYIWRACGGTATAVAYDLMSMTLETDM